MYVKAYGTGTHVIVISWAVPVSGYVKAYGIGNGYAKGCPPVRVDNPRALASGLSYVQVDKARGLSTRTGRQTWYSYFIPPTSV